MPLDILPRRTRPEPHLRHCRDDIALPLYRRTHQDGRLHHASAVYGTEGGQDRYDGAWGEFIGHLYIASSFFVWQIGERVDTPLLTETDV